MKKICVLLAVCSLLSACSLRKTETSPLTTNPYANDAARYRENVAVKAKSKDFVVYEYKDIRVDELAPLAADYCAEQGFGLKAYLRDIILYRNNLRRATFDCVSLAMEN